jgi:glycosyltransferase involved in cell wall biosynthesis
VRIALDATPLAPGKSGIGHITELLVRGLAATGELEEILLLSNRPPVFDGPEPPGTRWPRRHTFPKRSLWMQLYLPRLLREEAPDLVHYTSYDGPVLDRHPSVVSFHDMALYVCPEYFTWKTLLAKKTLMPRMARTARRILTLTEAVKEEIVQILRVPPERVAVAYPAPDDGFIPPESPEELASALAAQGVHRPYIFAVGTLEPRKNVAGLLRAFDLLKNEARVPHALVVAGARGWRFGPIFETARSMRHSDAVQFLDYVPLADLPALYAGADLFVYPSFYEGFGIPPVEAMRCGTPAVVSDIPPHREVGAGAVVRVDPHDAASIAEGMHRVLSDSSLAERLCREGKARAAEFTWQRTSRRVLEVYREALRGN